MLGSMLSFGPDQALDFIVSLTTAIHALEHNRHAVAAGDPITVRPNGAALAAPVHFHDDFASAQHSRYVNSVPVGLATNKW